MSRLLTVNEVCERALRKIGAYSVNDSAADGQELEEARWWLDMVVGHASSRKRTWWLVPVTAPLTLVAGTNAYALDALLGGSPDVQHLVGAWRVNLASGARTPLTLIRRQDWDDLNLSETGPPEKVFLDRARAPTLRIWPTPAATIADRVDLVFQKFADDTKRLEPTQPVPDMRQSWSLYLVTALAAEIGAGPVRRLPQDEVKEARARAKELLDDLEAFEEGETPGEFRLTAYHDF